MFSHMLTCFHSYLGQLGSSHLSDDPVLSRQELTDLQDAVPDLSRVLFFVEHERRLSRREWNKESPGVLRFLRHWNKLSARMGLLY